MIPEVFLGGTLHPFLFHVLKSMKNEVPRSRWEYPPQSDKLLWSVYRELSTHARIPEYDKIVGEVQAVVPPTIYNYFKKTRTRSKMNG